MTGRSPNGITAQGNTLGLSSLTNWRAVSATGASEMFARSFLLLFQSASLLEHLYPGRCPGLYSYWAFSPSLLVTSTVVWCHGLYAYWAFSPSLQRANPFFKIKQQNFKQNEVAERNISYHSYGRTRTDTDVS